MNFLSLVENRKLQARLENIETVRKEVDKAWVKTKISNHVARFGGLLTEESLREAILENDIVASLFAKDPSKQNITEKLVAEVLDLKKLPASGRNCIRFNNEGDIVSLTAPSHSKSADFLIGDFYTTQKFTTESGGAQDNQFNDVVDFLVKGSKKYKVAALLDGAFWDLKRDSLKKEFSNYPNVWITSVQEILDKDKEN